MLRKLVCALLLAWLVPGIAAAQTEYSEFELFRELIHLPTAGILKVGQSDVDMRIYSNSGIHVAAGLGLRSRITIGFTLGGENIIGDGIIDWNPQIEFDAKYRIFNEDESVPAVAIGFDSQGFGTYHEDLMQRYEKNDFGSYVKIQDRVRVDRYDYKSRGLYVVATKNYPIFGRLGLHGGFNISFENKDHDRDLNFFFGLDKSLGPDTYFMLEYDAAFNDNNYKYQPYNSDRRFGADEGLGYLNIGVRWKVAGRFSVEGALTDILESAGTYGRELRMTYLTDLFDGGRSTKKAETESRPQEGIQVYDPPSYMGSPTQPYRSTETSVTPSGYSYKVERMIEPTKEEKPAAKKSIKKAPPKTETVNPAPQPESKPPATDSGVIEINPNTPK